jgi:hypothetical protein
VSPHLFFFRALALAVTLAVFAGCPTLRPPCSASTCSGCCTDQGQCLAGSGQTTCGRGGTACKVCSLTESCVATTGACAPSSAGGGSALAGGAAGSGVGGGAGGGLAPGGGAAGGGMAGGQSSSDDVEVTCTQRWYTESDAGAVPCNFGSSAPQAVVLGDAGVTTFTPTVRPDGSFTLANVPRGLFFLRIGTAWYGTRERQLSLDYETLGRVDTALAGANTRLVLSAFNLVSWDEQAHFANLFSPGAGVAVEAFDQRLRDTPFDGDTEYDFTLPYDVLSQQLFVPLIDGARGDVTYLTQMSFDAASGEYRTLAAASSSTLTVTSMQLSSASFAMSSPPAAMTPLSIDQASFDAFAADLTPGTPSVGVEFAAGPRAVHERTSDGLAFVWGFFPSSVSTPPNPVSYPNPFPSTWGTSATVQVGNSVARQHPSAQQPRRYLSGQLQVLPLQSLASPVVATLSPPTSPQLNGAPLSGNHTGVGLRPSISFAAPRVGQPRRYQLRVEQLTASSGQTVARTAATFTLPPTETTLTLPPGVLVSGQIYVFSLSAVSNPGNLQVDVFDNRLPYATATVVSGLVRP